MNPSERWLLLRGLTRESRHWGGFPEKLQQAVGNAEVLTPDLPGNGYRHELASPSRVEEMVECYRQEMRERNIAPPYRLLALSLGAMVAIAWATRYAAEVDAVVLINTSVRPLNPFFRRLRPRSYVDLLHLAVAGADAENAERIILRRTSQFRQNDSSLVEAWAGFRRHCPVTRRNALRQLLAAWRYQAPASPPLLPILILASAGDQLVDPRCSKEIAGRWDATIAVHPEAGHDLPLDDPDWVIRQVREWLNTTDFERLPSRL